ncbi:MAG: sce7725 family protein, partial [Clostridia bacterium]|nr:sce7725 family protein [Clostridia bacterium]
MYFLYLRGKQFELIAIRELLENSLLSDKIIPIVEPVKLSSTLIKTVQTFLV